VTPISRWLAPAFIAVFAAASSVRAVEWVPVLNAEVSGGHSRFSGDRLEGPNGSLLFVPGMRIGENFSLLPIFSADYQKARDVQELAGGGFLTVAQHSRGASLRAIQQVGPLKLKGYGAFKQQLLKETKDEPWGEGLFDYDKTAVGLEVEGKTLLLESWRAGVDYYTTKFKNFQSLASQNAGAEVNAGEDVLDFSAVDVPLAADLAFGRQKVELKALTSVRSFPDQNVVHEDASFSGKRSDTYLSASAGLTRILPKGSLWGELESAAGLDLGYSLLDSNQNSYDASALAFHPNFYSYGELSAGPRWQFRWRGWLTGSFSYLFANRDYADRPAQDAAGASLGEPINTRTQTFRWNLRFPIARGFSTRLAGALQHADSNMANEATYRYNYTSSHYFLGVAWEI
jgi:hypothetical protein